jgi:hypothetical protein
VSIQTYIIYTLTCGRLKKESPDRVKVRRGQSFYFPEADVSLKDSRKNLGVFPRRHKYMRINVCIDRYSPVTLNIDNTITLLQRLSLSSELNSKQCFAIKGLHFVVVFYYGI